MSNRKRGTRLGGDILEEKCDECPCFHIIIDERKKIFKIFVEDCEGIIISIGFNQVKKLCGRISEVKQKKLREAGIEETDYLARKYLGVEVIEEK